MIKPAIIEPTERAAIDAGAHDIAQAIGVVDNLVGDLAARVVKARRIANSRLQAAPADVQMAIEAALKAVARGVAVTEAMAAAGMEKIARDIGHGRVVQ